MSKCKWNIKSSVTDQARSLSKEMGLSSVLIQLLFNRGYEDKDSIKDFLSPNLRSLKDPFLLKDMTKACLKIYQNILENKKICIYGDYDIDGTSSIAVIVRFFKSIGFKNYCYYQPSRFEEGYGLHLEAVKKIISDGANLIISVDCGSSNFETADYCKNNNFDLIITDHHKIDERIPEAYAFINPQREGNKKTFCCLAGVGVAYYLLIGLRSILREKKYFKNIKEPDLRDYLDLVAFGTIADVAPMLSLNRILVKKGVHLLNKDPKAGFLALKDISGFKGTIDTESVGFILAPRLNAPGRMGNANDSVRLLIENDYKKAYEIAKNLDSENKKRMEFQKDSWKDVLKIMKGKSEEDLASIFTLTFSSFKWHQGVIGIIASKSVEKWYKPTAVFSIDEDTGIAKGSLRSIPCVDVFKAVSKLKDILIDFGGHSMAAGVSLKKENLEEFKKRFEEVVLNQEEQNLSSQVLDIDLEVNVTDFGLNTVKQISKMGPFGSNNPKPMFFSKNIKILNKWVLKEKHLKLKLDSGIDAIGFNMAKYSDKLLDRADIVFHPVVNEWKGKENLQYRLVDLD
jgi:single-stranded-DNA-specific exonuclease